MTKQLPENIQKWVDALRSGQYTQQQGALKGPDGYCCLGVYCSINGKEPPIMYDECGEWDWHNDGPQQLYDFCEGEINHDGVYHSGIFMNDDGRSFSEIASMIEEKYNTP